MTAPQRSDRVLERLTRLHPKKIDLSLGRIERLLAALGNPHENLPPVVHVAGTKGKGSTVATMRACLEAAGHRVHAYISPHLVRFHERIRLAGRLIEEDALLAVLEECEHANRGEPITYFEITTAAAFLAFARTPADIVLLEVGVGGRLDATNVIDHPAVAAITPVSLDHQAFLGDTVAAIAGEKAGILKPGVAAVIGPQTAEAERVIEARAAAIGAPLYRWDREWRCHPNPFTAGAMGPPLSRIAGEGAERRRREAGEGDAGMRYEGARWRLDLPLPSLLGAHQIVNAGVALACLEQLVFFPHRSAPLPSSPRERGSRGDRSSLALDSRLRGNDDSIGADNGLAGLSLPPAALAEGLRQIDWPARLQLLRRGPLVERSPAGWELWLDGGHNPAAGEVLGAVAADWQDRPLDLIVGMLNTKDAAGFLRPLAPYARGLHAVTIPGEDNPLPAPDIAAAARSVGLAAQEAASVEDALRDIVAARGPARVLICGSLHLAGVVLRENG